MSLDNLKELFMDELRDIFSAERQLVKALPMMAAAATSPVLRKEFEKHLRETEKQVERLEQVFASIDAVARPKTCKAMQGLIDEGSDIISEDVDPQVKPDPQVKDAALIAAAQKIEHYEIAAYGTLSTWAKLLNFKKAVGLLAQTLKEEKATDDKLTELAETMVKELAMSS